MDVDKMQKLLQAAVEREQKRAAEEHIEAQIKIVSASYDKAIAYTNLIILAAYAGFFGLWQMTKEHLTKEQVLWSAILMLVSLTTFVLFEVWKSYHSSGSLLSLGRVLNDPANQGSITKLAAEIEKYNAQERKRSIWFGKVWHVTFIFTVLSGMSAVTVLGVAFVIQLLKS